MSPQVPRSLIYFYYNFFRALDGNRKNTSFATKPYLNRNLSFNFTGNRISVHNLIVMAGRGHIFFHRCRFEFPWPSVDLHDTVPWRPRTGCWGVSWRQFTAIEIKDCVSPCHTLSLTPCFHHLLKWRSWLHFEVYYIFSSICLCHHLNRDLYSRCPQFTTCGWKSSTTSINFLSTSSTL